MGFPMKNVKMKWLRKEKNLKKMVATLEQSVLSGHRPVKWRAMMMIVMIRLKKIHWVEQSDQVSGSICF